MSSKESLLAEVQFFQLLDPEERKALAEVLEESHHEAGAILFDVGDPGDCMYVVGSGAVEISATDKLGQKIVLTLCERGDMFGELSLLDMGARTARAVVTDAAELLALDRDQLRDFIRRKPDAALDMMTVMGRRMRATTERLRQMAIRNAGEEVEQKLTPIERVVDGVAAFSGSVSFLVIHILAFAAWIGWNVLARLTAFDPFPFNFLTLCVSLEAIFLSVIVLLSQNRQAAKDRIRDDIEYDANLKAELEISHLHEKVDRMQSALLSRLQRIEGAVGVRRGRG
jgi:CRP/FNR family transcriptional regulator, cyclic AMP receptor protein